MWRMRTFLIFSYNFLLVLIVIIAGATVGDYLQHAGDPLSGLEFVYFAVFALPLFLLRFLIKFVYHKKFQRSISTDCFPKDPLAKFVCIALLCFLAYISST